MFPSTVALPLLQMRNRIALLWPALLPTSPRHQMRETRWTGIQSGHDDRVVSRRTPQSVNSDEKGLLLSLSVAANTRIRSLLASASLRERKCCGNQQSIRVWFGSWINHPMQQKSSTTDGPMK